MQELLFPFQFPRFLVWERKLKFAENLHVNIVGNQLGIGILWKVLKKGDGAIKKARDLDSAVEWLHKAFKNNLLNNRVEFSRSPHSFNG